MVWQYWDGGIWARRVVVFVRKGWDMAQAQGWEVIPGFEGWLFVVLLSRREVSLFVSSVRSWS